MRPRIGNPNWHKGMKSPNPYGGIDPHKLRLVRKLEGLAPRAVAVLAENMGDPDPDVRHRAAVEVLNRLFGKPKSEKEVTVKLEDASTAHLLALQRLAEMGPTVIDVTPTDKTGA